MPSELDNREIAIQAAQIIRNYIPDTQTDSLGTDVPDKAPRPARLRGKRRRQTVAVIAEYLYDRFPESLPSLSLASDAAEGLVKSCLESAPSSFGDLQPTPEVERCEKDWRSVGLCRQSDREDRGPQP